MSIDLDIMPTISNPITWGNVKKRFEMILGSAAQQLLGEQILLLRLGSDEVVEENEYLFQSSYYLRLATQNTILISVTANEGNIDELDYLQDYGRNLAPVTIEELAKQWKIAGLTYALTSFIGRSEQESHLFVALACAIAEACVGYVIVMNDDLFDSGIGVYSAEQFRVVRPTF